MCKKKQAKPEKSQSKLSKKERKKAEKLEKKRLELEAQEALSAELNEQNKSDHKKGKKGDQRKNQTVVIKRKNRKAKRTGKSKKQFVLDAEALKKREHDFILDCIAVAQISKDGALRSPKIDSVIPTYDALRDPFSARYFQQPTVKKFMEKMNLMPRADEEIKVRENEYLKRRNVHGCGRSIEEYGGHGVTIRL
ncbi:hypothetical protein T265_08216 [Opisthorchis viverrini]|uniref:Uncharacterized protein n=1 Tax=Opisthorchis viverrini TaxID=6198 RepID=A0A074Z9X7_OPIVI|nr:hypothetical protein T265_08216 [Opisthorchis viverrini]KER24051.1 hypothetical protein T265_08216 [Opisthorchis viverrini]